MTALGVVGYQAGWTPPLVFWTTTVLALLAVVGGFALSLFWIALGAPALLWTLMSGVTLITGGREKS